MEASRATIAEFIDCASAYARLCHQDESRSVFEALVDFSTDEEILAVETALLLRTEEDDPSGTAFVGTFGALLEKVDRRITSGVAGERKLHRRIHQGTWNTKLDRYERRG